jgi:hypothetical protein
LSSESFGGDLMANVETIGIAALIGAVIASRFISESGLNLLSTTEKAAVIDAFSPHRKYSLLVLFLLLIPIIFLPDSVPRPAFFTIICLYLLAVMVLAHRRLKSLGVSQAYTQRYLSSQLVVAAGFGAYILLARI